MDQNILALLEFPTENKGLESYARNGRMIHVNFDGSGALQALPVRKFSGMLAASSQERWLGFFSIFL
jgi:hypothetical protein